MQLLKQTVCCWAARQLRATSVCQWQSTEMMPAAHSHVIIELGVVPSGTGLPQRPAAPVRQQQVAPAGQDQAEGRVWAAAGGAGAPKRGAGPGHIRNQSSAWLELEVWLWSARARAAARIGAGRPQRAAGALLGQHYVAVGTDGQGVLPIARGQRTELDVGAAAFMFVGVGSACWLA